MYSFVWQVVLQRNVAHYGKVEEFVILVMKTVPDLLSFKQSAQLILGLRARVRYIFWVLLFKWVNCKFKLSVVFSFHR